jgi:hypothetical protein
MADSAFHHENGSLLDDGHVEALCEILDELRDRTPVAA